MSDPECISAERTLEIEEVKCPSQHVDNIKTDNVNSAEKITDSATMNAATSEDSEYETLEEDNGESSKSSRSRQSSFSDQLSDGIGLEDEREDGDGQEENSSLKDKKLDDDEDRRNPQYIPKKGFFYEHDDRTMADENEESNDNDPNKREITEEGKEDTKNAPVKKGKVWIEKHDRWSHDLYNEEEQKPKTTQELIDIYGYDIRNEEAPPKARRRRRYGRGPNKYTRNWEDEDAYARSAPQQRRVFHNNREEFPELGEKNGGHRSTEKNQGSGSSVQQTQRVSPPQQYQQPHGERERVPRREWERTREEKPVEREKERTKPSPVKDVLPPAFEKHTERKPQAAPVNLTSPPTILTLERKKEEVETPKVGRGRGFRNTGKPRPSMEFVASKGRGPLPAAFTREPVTQVPDSLKHATDILLQDFSHIYISSSNANNNTSSNLSNIVEETIIPRSERRSHGHSNTDGQSNDVGGRPKRYSTQRRNLPETTPPPPYSPPQPHNIPYFTQPPPTGYVPAPVYNEVAPPPVTSPPMQLPLGVFLPPGPPPTAPAAPPYPPPPLLNYLPPPSYQPMALQPPEIMPGQFDDLQPPELYQGQQFEELSHGPAELYQTPGGITYYSTQTQSVVPRPNPPRRVKLAIPIVPPPDNPQQRGGSSKQHEVHSAVS